MPGKQCGVYVIEQMGTDRCYVGSSAAIAVRWYNHRLHLRRGKHHCEFLQRAWNKHGEDAFKFRVLEQCEPGELLIKEQQYIDAFKPEFNGFVIIKSRKLHPEIEAKRNMTPEQHARMLATKRKDYHRHGEANRAHMRQRYRVRVNQ